MKITIEHNNSQDSKICDVAGVEILEIYLKVILDNKLELYFPHGSIKAFAIDESEDV